MKVVYRKSVNIATDFFSETMKTTRFIYAEKTIGGQLVGL